MEESLGKYGECIRIFNHYTDKRHLLKVKTLCDVFNDMAELHTFRQGINVAHLNKHGLTWMLRHIYLEVEDMPRWEEMVSVETWNPGFEGLFVPRVYKVSDQQGKIRACAHTDWMIVNLESRRPERPAPWVGNLAGQYEEILPIGNGLMDRKELKGVFEQDACSWMAPREFRAVYSDIDFNGHVTQSVYMQWMLDAHGYTFQEEHRISRMEVMYAHEIAPDSQVLVEVGIRNSSEVKDGAGNGTLAFYRVWNPEKSVLHAWGKALWLR